MFQSFFYLLKIIYYLILLKNIEEEILSLFDLKVSVDPPFGAILAAAHFATWKGLAPPRVFSWEAGAESDDAFRMPMEVWQVA